MGFRDNQLESAQDTHMQLKDLHWFRQAVEAGNLHSAADALGITQPALSKAIQRLERSLNVRLLERTPRGVAPTAVGQVLHQRALLLGQWADDTRHQIQDLKTGQSGELRVGAVPALIETVMTPVLSHFLAQGPAVRFQVNVQLSGVLMQQLENGELDFAIAAIGSQVPAAFNCTVLGAQDSYVVARKGHPLLRGRFSVADMAEQSWVLPPSNIALRAWVETLLREHGVETPPVFIQSDASPAAFAPLVRRSDLLTVMTADSMAGIQGSGLVALPKPSPTWTLQLGLFWRRNAYFSVLMKEFREQVVKVFGTRQLQRTGR